MAVCRDGSGWSHSLSSPQVLVEQPFKKWCPLVDNDFRFGPEPLGEILLGAEFVYSKKGRKSILAGLPTWRSSKAAKVHVCVLCSRADLAV